ncbi:hypothetical protein BC941DRAFT_384163 [Chlamydoabsidia padenii]|nr:hypothetical protein BC941DRAFT_384163 [Chlamydoabsidia padenii]
MFGATGAFVTGVFGAIWYTKRKQTKYQQQDAHLLQQQQCLTSQKYTPPPMTPEEYALAKKNARFFALKSLTYGTLLALTGAGVLAISVGYWLDVRNFKEFSDKLHSIVPQHTARLRRALGGKDLTMTQEEEDELEEMAQKVALDE